MSAFDFWGGGAIATAVLMGFAAEQRWPLRRRSRPLGERLATNAAMVAVAAAVLRLAMIPAALAVAAAS
jgi:hypothetical protein